MDWPLFLAALLSATLLPGGSEALLIYKLANGGDPFLLVASATSGNILGSCITGGMGWLGSSALHQRWLRIAEEDLVRAERLFRRFGGATLLLAWLPIVGDPLCLLAGLLRYPPLLFLLLVTVGKLGRYLLVATVV